MQPHSSRRSLLLFRVAESALDHAQQRPQPGPDELRVLQARIAAEFLEDLAVGFSDADGGFLSVVFVAHASPFFGALRRGPVSASEVYPISLARASASPDPHGERMAHSSAIVLPSFTQRLILLPRAAQPSPVWSGNGNARDIQPCLRAEQNAQHPLLPGVGRDERAESALAGRLQDFLDHGVARLARRVDPARDGYLRSFGSAPGESLGFDPGAQESAARTGLRVLLGPGPALVRVGFPAGKFAAEKTGAIGARIWFRGWPSSVPSEAAREARNCGLKGAA